MQSIREKEPKWYKVMRKEIETKYIGEQRKRNPWTSKEMPTKGSWVVEKEQTGNFIGKILSLKDNEAVINHWIADRTKRTVTPNKYIMSDGARQSNMASRSKRIAGHRKKLHNSTYANSSNCKEKNKDRSNHPKESKLGRKAEKVQKKESYKIREILEMTNWASWLSWKTFCIRKQLKFKFKIQEKVICKRNTFQTKGRDPTYKY
ncbi:11069_t:CDS:2 [Gigaspora margarita]|uniref:11069_t:CDS:1 n=1 Tax=Gigaspora margarita TaxID=4874 RepID=A0ABN7VIS9_GIGMA|nr:11069_t:CDS:2 [Gigaspora margarita]